ncbi:hypothetical protein AB3X91_39815 [Paraburkholderia sp. BR14263]|uniref:hypothetical protein n=1 Tax=unclassified Paraburkholderia TaxID=2615204 RepID=UPI0034CDEEBB
MNTYVPNKDALDYHAASEGLDLKEVNGFFVEGPADVLIERLLDQVTHRGRDAFECEEDFLREAIRHYASGNIHGAVSNAQYAATLGSGRVLGWQGNHDRSLPLREALNRARNSRYVVT